MPQIYMDTSGGLGQLTQINERPLTVFATVFVANMANDELLRSIHAEVSSSYSGLGSELKSSKPHPANESFLVRAIQEVDWCYITAVARRNSLDGLGLKYPKSFNKWFIKKVLSQMKCALKTGKIEIDKGANDKEDRSLIEYLNKHFDDTVYSAVKNAECVDSIQSPGIQLADLIAGATRRNLEKGGRKTSSSYTGLLRRCVAYWEFPPPEWKREQTKKSRLEVIEFSRIN